MIQIEMEMADKCSECRFRTDYDFCSAMPKNFCGNTSDEGKPDWCPLKNVGGWISVKDRMPEGEFIAYSRKSGEMMMGFIGETDEGDTGYCCDSNTEWLGDVTHWMPLPSTEGLNET